MKVNLIGMILNTTGHRCFDGIVVDDDGKELPAADSLHSLIMEYSKVANGGTSSLVVVDVVLAPPDGEVHALREAARDFYNATVGQPGLRLTSTDEAIRDAAKQAGERLRALLAAAGPNVEANRPPTARETT